MGFWMRRCKAGIGTAQFHSWKTFLLADFFSNENNGVSHSSPTYVTRARESKDPPAGVGCSPGLQLFNVCSHFTWEHLSTSENRGGDEANPWTTNNIFKPSGFWKQHKKTFVALICTPMHQFYLLCTFTYLIWAKNLTFSHKPCGIKGCIRRTALRWSCH